MEMTSHSNETNTIEDILRRLSVTSRQNESFMENYRDGKLIMQIDLYDLMVDSTDTTNKLYSTADVWCHIKFGGELQKVALKALFAPRGCPVIFDVHEFYGPDLVEIKLMQVIGLFSEEISDISVRMKDILKAQEIQLVQLDEMGTFENNDGLNNFWGYEEVMNINYMKIGLKIRYSRLQNCLLDEIKFYSAPFVDRAPVTQGCTELHHIASLGNSDLMEQVLDSLARKGALKVALNIRSRTGFSVLEAALHSNNYAVVKTLLQRAGIWCFQGTQIGRKTPIHAAISSDGKHGEDLSRADQHLKFLDIISAPADFVSDHILGYDQNTRCLRAILRFLSRYHSNVDGWENDPCMQEMIEWRDEDDYTALMLACATGNANTIKLLLQYGADCGKITTKLKVSPLMLATKSGSLDAVMAILSDRVQFNIFDTLVASSPSTAGTKIPLVCLKCNPCHYDSLGNTALSIAAERGLVDIFEYFLSVGIPYHITDVAGNTPLHLASKMGYIEICQLILDAERDLIIKEIEMELGSAEGMKKELERTSSSFRGGLKSGCKSKVDYNKESVFSTMTSRRAWLHSKNYRGLSAADVARRANNIVIATLVENISRELYSQDFIELQVCHMLEGTHGGSNGEKSISRALSTLNSQIGFVRSLGTEEVRSISRLSNDMYDEDSFAATYSLALVTEGTVLGEYEDGQRDVIDVVTSTKMQLSTWNDSNSISSGHVENNMGVGSLKSSEHKEIQQEAVHIPSSSSLFHSISSSDPFASCSSLPIPIDISVMPEAKSKPKETVLDERMKIFVKGTLVQKSAGKERKSSSRPLRTKNGKIIDKDLALSLGISEEEYVEMLTSTESIDEDDLEVDSNEDKIELKRTSSLKNFTNQIISLKRSISDSKIKF